MTAALAGWEDRLRSLGSVAVDCLQPGISREQIEPRDNRLSGRTSVDSLTGTRPPAGGCEPGGD